MLKDLKVTSCKFSLLERAVHNVRVAYAKKYFESLCKLQFQSLNSTSPVDPLCSSTDIVIAVRKLSNQTS